MASASADPFHIIRTSLENEVTQLNLKFEAWRGALMSTDTATDVAFQAMHIEFNRELGKTEELCKKLKLVLATIERDRSRFPHVDDRELGLRRTSVAALDRALHGMRADFMSPATRGKIDGDKRRQLTRRAAADADAAAAAASSSAAAPSAYRAANSDFVRSQQQEQQTIRRQQDATLGKMDNALDRLMEMGRTIETELKDQERMLADIEEETDRAQGKMDGAIKKVQKLLKTKDNCQLATIAGLTIAFIIVALVAFYVVTG